MLPNGTETTSSENGSSQVQPPAISLPKGGGAIRGIGEKFAANPVTGTGSMSVPIATSPGRSGFGPELSLTYDSGSGNGIFGFGWDLSLPSITRKTDKGIPQYKDADESDVFILSSAEDLVPEYKTDSSGNRVLVDGKHVINDSPRTINGVDYMVRRYRPRIEGLFARIERWTDITTHETHWRSISRDNITTLYGKTSESRITDPEEPTHTFSWLICQSYDDKGNAIVYEYAKENSDNIERTRVHERNRTAESRATNRYIKRIKYGNRRPNRNESWLATDPTQLTDWMFEVVFDYDENHFEVISPPETEPILVRADVNPNRTWSTRQDTFSAYRAGFEVRTYRLCRRVLMFHHFPTELGINDCLVRSTEFTYDEAPIATFITGVTQSGYVRQNDDSYLQKSLPPLEFEYSKATISNEIISVDANSLENLPYGLDGNTYRWVDLDGEGISGILTEQDNAWYYKANMGNGSFAPIEQVAHQPSLAALNGGQQQLLDLAGDGQLDLALLDAPTPGFYERTPDERWTTFRNFTSLPNIAWDDPNLRFVDLTGDGHADILITEDNAFNWHESLAEAGFGPRERIHQLLDEEQGPRLVFADGTQSIYLADLSGDGLTDLACIRNGEVCYWPNLGYGRFGSKVSMDNAPRFDSPDLFHQQRIRLADIDGSGTTDIIYLGHHTIDIYRNESGNSWEAAYQISNFPYTTDISSVTVIDLLGNGTACLVWSSPLPADKHQPMRYLDLMGGQKPHLMIASKNNMGAETRVKYTPSTYFYLKDKREGSPWTTRLPFPVHVVERIETYDHISRNRFVTWYAYHHGYFDGFEREFRGFGMVEQIDTEEFAVLSNSPDFPTGDNINLSSHVPPVLTRTWFHTGAFIEGRAISHQFEHEYYREPNLSDDEFAAQLLPDTVLPPNLTPQETREAIRALKGSVLRQEVFALDGSETNGYPYGHPYTVSERSQKLKLIQPRGDNQHAVFYVCACNTLDYHYERNPDNPRITHQMSLEIDAFGNVLKQATIGYGRHQPDTTLPLQTDQDKQTQPLITYTENRFTNAIDDVTAHPDDHRVPQPCETRTYELTGYTPSGAAGQFQNTDFVEADPADPDGIKLVHSFDSEIEYEGQPTNGKQRRLIEHVRTLYRSNDLTHALQLAELESLALPFESYRLAFTPDLVTHLFGNHVDNPNNMLGNEGKYVHTEGDNNWWISSGQIFYSLDDSDSPVEELDFARQHAFLPHRFRDPFGATSRVVYDTHNLLMIETDDPLRNRVTVGERDQQGNITNGNDYRVLQPKLVTDPNRNRTEVMFDALGMVVGTAIMGKMPTAPVEGDTLAGFDADLPNAEIDAFFNAPDPHDFAPTLLQSATTHIIYDVNSFWRSQKANPDNPSQWQPVYAATLAREIHVSDLRSTDDLKIQISFSYSDGFGREIQQKIQAEPGAMVDGGSIIDLRWVGSGWTIFNNKGKPVRQYEPFFDDTHHFKFGNIVGVSPILFYDPLERVIATLHPNNTYEKVMFDPWQQTTYDVNDTVAAQNGETGDPRTDPDISGYVTEYFKTQPATWQTWYQARIAGPNQQEKIAAEKAEQHADTPTVAHFDTLGRPFLTIADNGTQGKYETRVELDIEGNQRAVIDARGRTVMRYEYDMLGNQVRQDSMEAGTRRVLPNVAGNPIYQWDSRNHRIQTTYDELQRPLEMHLQEDGATSLLVERIVYGESQGDAANHRGQIFQHFDSAGVVTFEEYDFKGNLLRSTRDFAQNYKTTLDWSGNVPLENETHITTTTYDALNRATEITTPDKSITRPTYNEANLLERVDVNLLGEKDNNNQPIWTPFVANIDYDAKGQRTLIRYGNRVTTGYSYDDETFRLTNLKTIKDTGAILQDLHYVYDPVGNITSIRDDAQQTLFFNNSLIEPHASYTYDAVYQLIEATGREHIGKRANRSIQHRMMKPGRWAIRFPILTTRRRCAATLNGIPMMRSAISSNLYTLPTTAPSGHAPINTTKPASLMPASRAIA